MTGEGSQAVGRATARPNSVVWYERLAWIGLAISLVVAASNTTAIAKYYYLYPITYPIMFIGSFAGQLLWIWLVARKRQNWARRISLVVILVGIPTVIWNSDERIRLNAAAEIADLTVYAVWIAAVSQLFRQDAGECFRAVGRKKGGA